MKRPGWTLHEMLISLGVLSGVMALAAHLAAGQLRFFRNAGQLASLKGQIGHASGIASSVLWGVSPSAGDIAIALDSAIEVHMPIAAALACASTPGRVTVAQPVAGPTLASFMETPGAGDRMQALFEDTLGVTWLTFHVAGLGATESGCIHFPHVVEARTVALQEPIAVAPGSALRFTRPVRLSLYRGSDRNWYLGMRDWNGESQRFNTIQPVAGPLKPYSADAAQTGVLFVYRDDEGVPLPIPADPMLIASITVVSRATHGQFSDSSAVTIALRNAR
jgi:hypothetical protein